IDEDYHSIKDDIPLVSVYTTGNVLIRGMLISDEFPTKEIHAIDDFKNYEMMFVGVYVLMNQPQPVVSTKGTHSTRELDEEEIEKMVKGEGDAESYASEFANSMINEDVDDSGTRIEPESHMEHQKNVNDDDEEIEKEKKNDDVEKTDEVVKEKIMMRIQEVLDHCNNVVPEMTFAKTNEMINKDMLWLVNLAVNKDLEVDLINAQEMISKEFATHGLKMVEELFRKHMQNKNVNLYPSTSSSTAKKSSVDLQHQLYLNMK
nr:hypothetical protein [Tanacetum cinerariifolium]